MSVTWLRMVSCKIDMPHLFAANASEIVRGFFCHLYGIQFIRFMIVGGVNSLFGFAVYSIAIVSGLTIWISLLLGTLLGIFFSFVTTGAYVFRKLSAVRLPSFFICHFFIFGINLILIDSLLYLLPNKILIQLILLFPMSLLAYFLSSRFVFNKQLKGISSESTKPDGEMGA
jgi:putative flippase GtrA